MFIFPEKDSGHPMNYLEMQQTAGVVARNVWIHGMFRFSQKTWEGIIDDTNQTFRK